MKNNFVYLKVEVEVRNWNGAYVNGVKDIQGDLIANRKENYWIIHIDLQKGIVKNWNGKSAIINYKITPNSKYTFYNENNVVVKEVTNYIPKALSSSKHQNTISLIINENGKIENWRNIFYDIE